MFDKSKIENNIDDEFIRGYSHVDFTSSTNMYFNFLKYISDFFENEIILDIGTYAGHSALVLSLNGKNKVESFDVKNIMTSEEITNISRDFNIKFLEFRAQDIPLEKYEKAKIIFLDIIHNGCEEREVFEIILKSGFNGILICDDINFNSEMESFWNGIILPKTDKIIDRESGFGAILFDSKYEKYFPGVTIEKTEKLE